MRVETKHGNTKISLSIPNIYGPDDGFPKEHRDIMPRMRAIAVLWDEGWTKADKWTVVMDNGEFVLNV